jgi:hypothetical protein
MSVLVTADVAHERMGPARAVEVQLTEVVR